MKNGAHVEIESVSHRYSPRGPLILEDVNLKIEPGEQIALVGRSGCGKSTLLQITAGMVRPRSGSVWIDGREVTRPSSKWNMMFQKPSLYPWMNVNQNAALGMKFAGASELAKERIPELLELVQMSEYGDRNVQLLSGGQQQRVALARSIATDPELLLLDEPFSSLDVLTRRNLQRDVVQIAQDRQITLVIVTHDTEEAVSMADRIVLMAPDPGRLIRSFEIDLGLERDPRSPEFKKIQDALLADLTAVAPDPMTEGPRIRD